MGDPPRVVGTRIQALGPPEVRRDDGPVALSPKLLALLVYLAVAPPGETVRRDTLLALLWPDLEQARARNALNQALHQLRRHLGEEAVESRGKEEVALGAPVTADVPRFEERVDGRDPAAALELYRGEFLEGFHVTGAPGFERWLDGVRARLRRRARDAAVELARDAAEAGRRGEAAAWLRRALEVVPTDERVTATLVDLLLRRGDRAGAVRAYRAFARRLDEELGMEPSPQLRERVAKARAGSAAPDGPGLEIISVPPLERRMAANLVDRAGGLAEGDRTENAAARELLLQAVDLDATYAPAWATGARATAWWVRELGGPSSQAPAAVAAGNRAVELAPEAPASRVALGLALEAAARPQEAVEAAGAGLRLDAGNAEASALLARVQTWAGNYGTALETARLAARNNEGDLRVLAVLAGDLHALELHGEGDEAYRRLYDARPPSHADRMIRVFIDLWFGRVDRAAGRTRKLLEEEPDGFMARFSAADVAMATGDADAAIEHWERCFRMDPDSRDGIARSTRTLLGAAHLEAGDAGRGRKLLAAAEAADRRALAAGATWSGIPKDLAMIHAARGETEQALHWLERAYSAGSAAYFQLRTEPVLAPLRTEDRFRRLTEAMERDVAGQRASVTGASGR